MDVQDTPKKSESSQETQPPGVIEPHSATDRPRERIFARADERFMKEGFARITVDDLTSDLSMSKKTFYKVFRSKEDLVEQLIMRALGNVALSLEKVMTGDITFPERIRGFMSIIPLIARRVDSPMAQDIQRHLPMVWARIEEFRRGRMTKYLTRILEQGKDEGYIRPDVPVRLLVLSVIGAVQSIVRPMVLAEESFSTREAVAGIFSLFLRGSLTDTGREAIDTIMHETH
jgi:AcrR family transcriptional regulator